MLRVRRVAVVPDLQGSGIGRALMEWAHRHALDRGFSEVRLGVRAQLPGNRAFYETLGYRVVKAHTRPGSGDVVWFEMSRPLAAS